MNKMKIKEQNQLISKLIELGIDEITEVDEY